MENKSIIKEIKNLKKEIVPRPEWIALSRDILLQQINPQKQYQKENVGIGGYVWLFSQIFRQRVLEPAVVMFLILGAFLTSSLIVNAAFYSMPGEPLYRVKIALENSHAALISNEDKKAEMKMEFAQNRMAELDKIVAQANVDPQEKTKQIAAVVAELKNNVGAVNDRLNKIKQSDGRVSDSDKEQTLKIAISISSKTEELAKSLDEKIGDLTAVEKMEVKDLMAGAVASVQQTSLSAQQIVKDANQPTNDVKQPQGEVKGEATDQLLQPESATTTNGAIPAQPVNNSATEPVK